MATTSEAAIEAADYLEYGKNTPMFGGEQDGRRAARDAMLSRYAKAIRDLVGENADLLEALKEAERYVFGAYECAFPDAIENDAVLQRVREAIAKAEGKV